MFENGFFSSYTDWANLLINIETISEIKKKNLKIQ